MIWLLWKLLTLPFRIVSGVLGTVLGAVRFLGVGRILAFGAGVCAGLAFAPTDGRRFRAAVVDRQQSLASTGGDLGATIRHELANSPRTWHLPQPSVAVDGARVVLTGSVPHDEARQDLVRTVGAVPGVRAVDDLLTVERSTGGGRAGGHG